jgi:CRISPR type IV-associated protein Csf2
MDITIRGALQTTSFVHQTSPSGKGEAKGKCMKTSIIGPKGLVRNVPYVTANSVRGLIRRAAGDVIFDALKLRKERINRNLYLSIVRGSYARSGVNAGGATYPQLIKAAGHVFAGLFGGGAYMYHSTVRMDSDLIPLINELGSTFSQDVMHLIQDVPAWQLIEKTMMAPRDDFARLPTIAREVVEDVERSYSEHMLTKEVQRDAKSAAKDAGEDAVKDDLDNFMGEIECIVPGTPLYFSLSARSITESQAGLLLKAVQSWANRNALGGGSARGRGTFKPVLALTVDGEKITDNLLNGDAPYLALTEHEAVTRLLSALADALTEDASKSALESVYPTEIKETGAAKKRGKAAKVADAPAQSATADAEEV